MLCNGAVSGKLRDGFTEITTGLNMSWGRMFCFLNSRSTDTDLENGCVDMETGLMVGDESGG